MAVARAQQLADTLREILEGEPWYAFSLQGTLHGITAVAAAARPLRGAHSIWEIAAHIDAWNRLCLRRLAGESVPAPPVDFPVPHSITPEEWREVQARLDESCRAVIAAAARLNDAQLSALVPGKHYPVSFLLEGASQHWIYHSGQIAMLRRALNEGA